MMSRVDGLGNVNAAERDAVWSQPNNWTIALKSHASKVSRAVARIECAYLEKLVKRKSTTPSNLQPGVPEVAHRGQLGPWDTLTCKRAEVQLPYRLCHNADTNEKNEESARVHVSE